MTATVKGRPLAARLRSTTALVGAGFVGAGMILAAPGQALAQEDEVEEIVVTGSYIRRTSFDSASPLAIMGSEDIEREGEQRIGELFKNLTFNTGSDFTSNAFSGGAGASSANVNLRGLGPQSTLVLLNGRRQVKFAGINADRVQFVDVNTLVPTIAIDRIETIKDGAAALYGSEAVAGVVNFITRHNFEGAQVEFEYRTTTDDPDNHFDLQGIFGGSAEKMHFMAAFRYHDTNGIKTKDRQEQFRPLQLLDFPQTRLTLAPTDPAVLAGLAPAGTVFGTKEMRNVSLSAAGSPGTFRVPLFRNPDGELSGAALPVVEDPLCGAEGVGGLPFDLGPNVPGKGQVGQCFFAFSGDFNVESPNNQYQGYAEVTRQMTSTMEFRGNFGFSQVRTDGRTSASFPPQPFFQPIPGENPGNPFPAIKADGTPVLGLVDPDGNPVFQKLGAGGVPLFDSVTGSDEFGDRVLTDRSVAVGDRSTELVGRRIVVLSQAEVDALTAAGTPPANPVILEDLPVGYSAATFNEVVGFLGTVPRGNDGVELGGLNSRRSQSSSTVFRFEGVLAGDMPFLQDWTWETGFVYAQHERSIFDADGTLRDPFNRAVIGEGGPVRDQFFNPFGNAVLASEGDPEFNDPLIFKDIEADLTTTQLQQLSTWDAHTTGPLFELPWSGTVGFATGVQWRRQRLRQFVNDTDRRDDLVFVGGEQAFQVPSREVWSVFGELAIPILTDGLPGARWLGDFEIQAAVRHENFDEGNETTDPKVAAIWRPFDSLSLRGSWGTSFKAPDLFQVGGLQSTVRQLDDPFTGISTFFTVQLSGSGEVTPQTSKSSNAGFTWQPTNEFGGRLEGLTVEFDYWRFKFDDVIGVSDPQGILNADFADDGIANDPRVRRTPGGDLIDVLTPFFNASSLLTKGIDLSIQYRFDTDRFGLFTFRSDGTWIETFDVQEFPGAPTVDAVGQRNQNFGFAPPTPEFRVNTILGWAFREHTLSATLRFTDNFLDDDNVQPQGFAKVDAHFQVDLQYSVVLPWSAFQDERQTTLTFGSLNVFDNMVPLVHSTDGGVEARAGADPRGRFIYFKIGQEF